MTAPRPLPGSSPGMVEPRYDGGASPPVPKAGCEARLRGVSGGLEGVIRRFQRGVDLRLLIGRGRCSGLQKTDGRFGGGDEFRDLTHEAHEGLNDRDDRGGGHVSDCFQFAVVEGMEAWSAASAT
jgi:hypothetical protein